MGVWVWSSSSTCKLPEKFDFYVYSSCARLLCCMEMRMCGGMIWYFRNNDIWRAEYLRGCVSAAQYGERGGRQFLRRGGNVSLLAHLSNASPLCSLKLSSLYL